MSDIPRGWPGVTVPEDYYDGEVFAATPPASSAKPLPRTTQSACRHRPSLAALWLGLSIALIATLLFGGEQLGFVRLIIVAAMSAVTSIGTRRDVVLAEGGAFLLLHRRSASAASGPPTEVTSEQIICLRHRSTNRFGRYFRPEVWQVGPERIIVNSDSLRELLAHHAQEATPS
ncbi:MAG: hypothetical protein ABMA25_07910 [Ilumatobacteraceae bacterium]